MYISFTAFSRNWAQVGGAIFGQDECIITLVYSTLAGNWANNPSVPDHHLESWGDQDEDPYRGGGIFIWFGDLVSKPSSSSCRFCAICALSMLSQTAHVGFVPRLCRTVFSMRTGLCWQTICFWIVSPTPLLLPCRFISILCCLCLACVLSWACTLVL